MRSSWILSCLTCTTLASCTLAQTSGPFTIAESSGFRATARYDDVMAFISELADRSSLVRVAELGVSSEGRSIPLIILADPPVDTPDEARKSGKLIVFALGKPVRW